MLDIGLMAEALIYYDQVVINVTTQPEFAELLSWFILQGKFTDLIALFSDGTLQVYDYAFMSAAAEANGEYTLVNIQDPIQAQPHSFEGRFLNHESVKKSLEFARRRSKLHSTLRDKVIEVKASEFGNAIENARADFSDPGRSSILLQTFLDEIAPLLGWQHAPVVSTTLSQSAGKQHITWNVNLDQISKALGKDLNFHRGTPLTAAAICNRLLWSAANLNCDLYLGSPMSSLVGDKLYESETKLVKTKAVVEQLITEVEFPNIRMLVNQGKLNLDQLLSIRKKAQRFRHWLQAEGEHDRNAIIAYHHEVAREGRFPQAARTSLRLFGFLGGAAAGALATSALVGGPDVVLPAVMGATAGTGVQFLFDLTAKLGAEWKPVVFGNWLTDRIQRLLDKS